MLVQIKRMKVKLESLTILWIITAFMLVGCHGNTASNDITPTENNRTTVTNDTKQEFVQEETLTVKTFSSTSGFSGEVHVMSSSKGNVLVDAGFYDKNLADYVESIGGLDAILLTHGHWDHTHALDDAAKANPDAKVYIHELDVPFLRDPHLNCSDINGFSLLVDTKPLTFTEGMIQVGDYEIEVMHTPGHTSGSSCFYLEEENILFTGDTFMLPFNGSPDHPTGNKTERQETIEKFKARSFKDDMKIYPGHQGNTTYKEMMETNVDLQ